MRHMIRGDIPGLNEGADFYAQGSTEPRQEFKKSLKVFFEVCEETEIDPKKENSGKFNLSIPLK